MWIYYVLVALILVMSLMRWERWISNKVFCCIICICFILVTGLRAYTVGMDTVNYYNMFVSFRSAEFSEILSYEREVGFYILAWLIQRVFGSFVVLSIVIAALFYIPVARFIYKYSSDSGLSFILLMSFCFFQFSMTGMRQTAAFGIMFLLLDEFAKRRISVLAVIKVVLLFLIGFSFHQSFLVVLVYLPVFWISKFPRAKYWIIAVIPLFLILYSVFISTASTVFYDMGLDFDAYKGSGAGVTTMIVFILISVAGFAFVSSPKEQYSLSDPESAVLPNEFLISMVIASLLQTLVMFNSIFFRITWYFSLMIIVYFPRLLAALPITKQSHYLVDSVSYVGVLGMYLFITIGSSGVVPYQFFWQVPMI